MAADDDFQVSPERLAELQAISDAAPHPISKDAREATPEEAAWLRRSALAYFAHLPVSEQVFMLGKWPQSERDEILAELPDELRERLLTLTVA